MGEKSLELRVQSLEPEQGDRRPLERAAIADLGPPGPAADVQRIIATGGGAVVDPRNRWALYRGRATIWLDGRPEVLAQRLRRKVMRRRLQGDAPMSGTRKAT